MTTRALLGPLFIALAACRPASSPAPTPTLTADPCVIRARSASPSDSVTIGADGAVQPGYALSPTTPADHLVFAQVFETLVRVTCDGRVVAGLADRWTDDGSGGVWTLTIRTDARFSDGTAVTTTDVVTAWRERQAEAARRQVPGPSLSGVTIIDGQRLSVHFRDPQPGGPRLLADPHFAVHRRGPRDTAPVGSASHLHREPPTELSVLEPVAAGAAPVLRIVATPSHDPRNLIDRGVDVLLTWDRRVVDYATARPELKTTSGGPDRTYVLLAASRSAGGTSSPAVDDPRWRSLRASLARDIVRATGEPAGFWWGTGALSSSCATDATTPPGPSRPRARRLVYPAGDRLAGDLAQRIVALASHDRGPSSESAVLGELIPELLDRGDRPFVAAGLSDSEFSRSLMGGTDAAYVIVVPQRPLDACGARRSLAARAPWLEAGPSALIAEAGPTLITGPRAPAVTIDWDNTLRVAPRAQPQRDPR